VEDHIIRGDGPTATSSKISYLLSGPVSHVHSLNVVTSSLHVSSQDSEACDVQQFWDLEITGTTVDNNVSYKIIHRTASPICQMVHTVPDSNGKRTILSYLPILIYAGNELAYRLSQTPGLPQTYNIIGDQLNRGFIERVFTPEVPGQTHFIPHHSVRKNSIKTPLCIVYDCSCCQSKDQSSLNDSLLTGPHFLNDLCS